MSSEKDEYAARHLEAHMREAGMDVGPMLAAKKYLKEEVLSRFLEEDQTFVNGGKRWQVYLVLVPVEDPAIARGQDLVHEGET
jgi:hypothetical protein